MDAAYRIAMFVMGLVLIRALPACGEIPQISPLKPNEILVIANRDMAASVDVARYYCRKRGISIDSILYVSLGKANDDWISRARYDTDLVPLVRERLLRGNRDSRIRCLLTTYGIPFKVGPRKGLPGMNEIDFALMSRVLQTDIERERQLCKEKSLKDSPRLRKLQQELDQLNGKGTNASVDSELSMARFADYDLRKWVRNELQGTLLDPSAETLMVCRLDGPRIDIIKEMIDKALEAEKTGLKGVAYVDSRGLPASKEGYGQYDQYLRDLAQWIHSEEIMPVKHEQTSALFPEHECPQTALYCGWYSLSRYISAFTYADGAVGYHIASYEAINLRDPRSTQWCPAMIMNGITATLGPVSEPYLQSFPPPLLFFQELCQGRSLVEAFYHTKPFNSWQLVLIGDPLYTPFKAAISR